MRRPTTTIDVLLHQQHLLADFGAQALQSDDLDALLTTACRLVADALGTQRAKVFELHPAQNSLFARAGVGWTADIIGQLSLPLTEGTSESYALQHRHPVISRDLRDEDRFDIPDFMKREGIVSLANAPIFLPGGAVYGLLQVDDTTPRDFTDEDIQFLRVYCSILGQVVDRLIKERALRSSEDKFRMTVEAATDYAIYITDAAGRITDWLPGAEAIFGWTAAEVEGRSGAIIFTHADRAAGQPDREIETARRTGRADDIREHLRKDGTRVFIEGVTRALYDTAGRPAGFVKIGRDQTARRDADLRMKTLMEGIPQLVWRSAAWGMWTWASPQWLSYTGQTQQQTHGMGWMDAVHPDDHAALRAAWAEANERDELDIDFRIRRDSDGAHLWHHTRSRPVRNSGGDIVEWLGTSTDVQAMKELQERQQVMVAELQHRTRNLIGVVGSIASQTMAETGPTPVFLEQFNDRLAALSRVQGLLSRSDQSPITIRSLLEMELRAITGDPPAPGMMDGPDVRIRPTIVQTLALALHELATNARKSGALSETDGRLQVRWQLRRPPTGARLFLEWRETGIAPPVSARTPASGAGAGYGRMLIERALPYSLGADTRYDLGADGLLCTIDLPLERATSSRGDP